MVNGVYDTLTRLPTNYNECSDNLVWPKWIENAQWCCSAWLPNGHKNGIVSTLLTLSVSVYASIY